MQLNNNNANFIEIKARCFLKLSQGFTIMICCVCCSTTVVTAVTFFVTLAQPRRQPLRRPRSQNACVTHVFVTSVDSEPLSVSRLTMPGPKADWLSPCHGQQPSRSIGHLCVGGSRQTGAVKCQGGSGSEMATTDCQGRLALCDSEGQSCLVGQLAGWSVTDLVTDSDRVKVIGHAMVIQVCVL